MRVLRGVPLKVQLRPDAREDSLRHEALSSHATQSIFSSMPSPSVPSSAVSASSRTSGEEQGSDNEEAFGGAPDQEGDGSRSKSAATFESLGLIQPLLTAIDRLKYTAPTEIQEAVVPLALEGRDIIGVAATVRRSSLESEGVALTICSGIRQNGCFCTPNLAEAMGGT